MRDHRIHSAGALIEMQHKVWLDQHACSGLDQRAEGTFSLARPTKQRTEPIDGSRDRCAVVFAIGVCRRLDQRQARFEVQTHEFLPKRIRSYSAKVALLMQTR